MRKLGLSILIMLASVLVAACQPTGDTTADPEAVQQVMPNINGYERTPSNSLVDAVGTGAAGAALASGNLPLAATINRAEAVVECLRDVGAIDLQTYVEASPANVVPEAGAVMILNTTRATANFGSCLAEAAQPFSAQSVSDPPCMQAGNFTYLENEYFYVYVGAGNNLCGFFSQHFANLGATVTS